MIVTSKIPGRIRIIDCNLKYIYPYDSVLESKLTKIDGILSVKINTHLGSMLVYFDFNKLSEKKVIECIKKELENVVSGRDRFYSWKKNEEGRRESGSFGRLFRRVLQNMIKDFVPRPLSWIF